MRQSPLEFELQRVVIRGGGVVGQADEQKIRIRVYHLSHPKQVTTDRCEIRGREALAAAQRLLERDIPLIAARYLQISICDQDRVHRRSEPEGGRRGVL